MMNSPKPNAQENRLGIPYLILYLVFLPGLLNAVNGLLSAPLSSGKLNFVYYTLNFLAVCLIFRRYLLASAGAFGRRLLPALSYALLGFLVNMLLGELLGILFLRLYPDFGNLNDAKVSAALQQDFILMAVGTVLLVPVAEETLFRGLLFRTLYDRSRIAAYLVSILAFALIHVMGYIGTASPSVLLISFIQYLPAGLCLCLAYRFGGSLFSSIILHAAINAAAVLSVR